MEAKQTARRHGVLVKLNDAEQSGLEFLRERECLPKAQVLRRLLIREVRASHQTGDFKMGRGLVEMERQPAKEEAGVR